VSAYIATIARYENGEFTFDPPRTPWHALFYLLRGVFIDRGLCYEPEARVYTSSPTTIHSLFKQRKRWNSARIEVTGRFWPALGYHWTLGVPALIVKVFMTRTVLLGLLAVVMLPELMWHSRLLTVLTLFYGTQLLSAALLTLLSLLISGEARYLVLFLSLPLAPVYTFLFKWLPAAVGFTHDVFLFGNVTGFAPEQTLIKGGSQRIALLFRLRRACLLALRAVLVGDVPFGRFWFGWHATRWTPNGFEGFTSGKKPRSILPPRNRWFPSAAQRRFFAAAD
jgi:cellulose synthase/poly-beta-1,6-N-acetylglucosamine synthase-like glycosyltransferase